MVAGPKTGINLSFEARWHMETKTMQQQRAVADSKKRKAEQKAEAEKQAAADEAYFSEKKMKGAAAEQFSEAGVELASSQNPIQDSQAFDNPGTMSESQLHQVVAEAWVEFENGRGDTLTQTVPDTLPYDLPDNQLGWIFGEDGF